MEEEKEEKKGQDLIIYNAPDNTSFERVNPVNVFTINFETLHQRIKLIPTMKEKLANLIDAKANSDDLEYYPDDHEHRAQEEVIGLQQRKYQHHLGRIELA